MGAGESKGAGDGGSPEQGSLLFSEESLPTLQQAWDKEACITYSACDAIASAPLQRTHSQADALLLSSGTSWRCYQKSGWT